MREILFRAKDADTGNWREGFYIHLHKTTYCFAGDYAAHPDNDIHQIVFESMTDWGLPNQHLRADIKPETLGQFTGLLDRNGRRIFEGDILKGEQYPFKYNGAYNYFAEVCSWENCPAFGLYVFKNPKSEVNGISTGNTEDMAGWESSDWEVIGNVYDNPELGGGGK